LIKFKNHSSKHVGKIGSKLSQNMFINVVPVFLASVSCSMIYGTL